jgi:hypothetical protein
MRAIRTPFHFDQSAYDAAQLETMRLGGAQLLDATLSLQARQQTVLSKLAPKNGVFTLWEHYPGNEVIDSTSACQYYYHSHRTSALEHGHFHLFALLHADGSPRADNSPWGQDEAPTHLIAISMSPQGFPIKVFCPNLWVTQGYWLPAQAILDRLDQFVINGVPRWSTHNRWIAGFVKLFRPQIAKALHARDMRVRVLRQGRHWRTFWADEAIEVINYVPIDLHRHILALENAAEVRKIT